MGVRGMGIFDNDIALDLRDGVTAALAEGLLVGDATEWLRTQYAEAWDCLLYTSPSPRDS